MQENEHYLKKELYELVEKDEKIFDFLQSGSLDGIWYWDLENPEHEWLSPKLWESFGVDPSTKEHLASEWQNIINADDLKLAIDNFEKHCADPDYPYDQVVRYKHSNGSTVWVRCRGIAIRDKDNKPIRMLGAHNDITALKNAELALKAKNDELRSFSQAISHDLKSPLRTIKTLNNWIMEDWEDPEFDRKETCEQLNRVTSRLITLVDDLHSFTTLTEGHSALLKEEIFIESFVSEILEDLHTPISEVDAKVEISCDIKKIVGYESVLRQIFQNLVMNAVKYRSPERPLCIEIVCQNTPTFWKFSVADNGLGIEEKHQEKVFGSFKRLHRYEEIEGSGLGLSLCKKGIEFHHGEMWLNSTLDKGSSFIFTLPKPLQGQLI